MNPEVTDFIEALKEPWHRELSVSLREVVHQAIPDALERIQYKKPHFLKNGKYAAVISTSKDAVSFTIFNAAALELPEGMFEGPAIHSLVDYAGIYRICAVCVESIRKPRRLSVIGNRAQPFNLE